ncbi:MAG: hypothetical protein JO006_01425 [Paucibacter sp.]|nr:hypothetical protein [Roseateles sp.]
MNAAGTTVTAVLPGQREAADGERLPYGFDASKLLWFDAAGDRIDA